MRKVLWPAVVAVALSSVGALAHHGWGSYDAAAKFIIKAPVEQLMWQNPHVHLMLKHQDADWSVILAPISRMERRGLSPEMLKIGTAVEAEGYPSTRTNHEMRAERITVNGKTFEMR